MVLNGKMLYASFTPPAVDCPLYFVELYLLNPSQAARMSTMNSVSELLILERKAQKADREIVVQVFMDAISYNAPSDSALPETLVHQLQMPKFVFHHEKRKMCPAVGDDGVVATSNAPATKKVPLKERDRNRAVRDRNRAVRDRNRAVRESLRKCKEARHSSENSAITTVSPPEKMSQHSGSVSVTLGDDVFSEVMGSSADQLLLDDFSVPAECSTSSPLTGIQKEEPLNCTTPQSKHSIHGVNYKCN